MAGDSSDWYFDYGERSTESENPITVFGRGMTYCTRDDVTHGVSDYPFDKTPHRVAEGLARFTQTIARSFVQHTNLSAESLAEKHDRVEADVRHAASENGANVDDIAVQASPRNKRDDEVEVSLTFEKGGDTHSTTFYLGPESAINPPGRS